MELNVELSPKFRAFFMPHRYKVAYGGRGSGKSWGVAKILLLLGYQKTLRILCAREYQNSIRDSVLTLLADQVESLGLQSFYKITEKSITGLNGTEFIFKGLRHNIQSVKSTEGVDICWVEEAQTVSEQSWSVLIPTIRKPGSEIWVTFNPHMADDPTYKRFISNTPPDSVVELVNYLDNPWLPDELLQEADYLKRVDNDAYMNVWLGQCTMRSDAQVLNGKWRIDRFDMETFGNKTAGPRFLPDGPYYGADWGFAKDPTTLVRCWIWENKLWIDYEAFAVGCDIIDTPELFEKVPDSNRRKIRADCARPETISHMSRKGFDIEGAPKWSGSVEDGVAFLRSFEEIIIHERCKHAIEEARLWSYKEDPLTGDILPKLVDKHNHIWDAVRYALAPMIQAGRGGMNYGSWL